MEWNEKASGNHRLCGGPSAADSGAGGPGGNLPDGGLFVWFHGITPKEARDPKTRLQVFPKMQVSQKQQYSWKLERKPAFRLMGKGIRCSHGEQQLKIPEFWNDCQKNGLFSRLISMDKNIPRGLFGVFRSEESCPEIIEYFMMAAADGDLPSGWSEIHIPEVTWAVFDCRGSVPRAIQNGWKYLQEEWLSKYPFGHARCPELEWYSSGNFYDETYLSQIWIPVITDGYR